MGKLMNAATAPVRVPAKMFGNAVGVAKDVASEVARHVAGDAIKRGIIEKGPTLAEALAAAV